MRKILFIAAHRKDRAPNQRFRFEQYFSFLEANGFQCDLSPLISAADDRIFYSKGNYARKILIGIRAWWRRYRDTKRLHAYDIVFVAREAFMTGSTFFEKKFRSSRARMVYDFDDAIWIDVVSANNKALGWLKDAGKTARIIAMADLVFAGNAYLAGYAKKFNSNVAVIPTTIDTEHYRPGPRRENGPVVIGWSGSVSTIEHFEHAVPALQKIKERYGSRISIKVIGDGQYKSEALGILGRPWNFSSELHDLQEIDIGIMPLPDDEWARGKCGLKGLQYMALEIPTIMSPVGVNSEIIQDGINGFLADSEEAWIEKLARLIEQPSLRQRIGAAGRETVVQHYSVISQQSRYLQYFNALLR
ncbi:MAG TPA: glycosyltransferase family 4 protein [Ohtaekwangia sp.]|nr:glycosyltransferase family 4 protein [Ohtaekwangia sp.]